MSAKREIIKNFGIKEITPNFEIEPFHKYSTQLKKLWTDRKMYEVAFDLEGVSDKIANAIRRTALTELEVKALTFDVSTIQTNINFIIADELLDRIQFLPIVQDIPDDAIFSISIVNSGSDREVLYSSHIVSDSGKEKKDGGKDKKGEKDKETKETKENKVSWIPQRFHLAELRPGEYLHIPKITVVRGKGQNHGMFSMTSDYCYRNLDFMDVAMINIKGNRLDKMVSVRQVAERIKELKLSKELIPNNVLAYKRILVIPNADYKKLISDDEQSKIDMANYDYILLNPAVRPSPVEKENELTDTWITERSSLIESSTEFRIKFYITNRIEPETLLPIICTNMINRLQMILDDMIIIGSGKVSIRTDPVTVKHGPDSIVVDMWKMRIKGETHTIGHLIVKHLVMLDPDLPFARPHMDHPQDTNVTIQIIHPEPEKICKDVLTECIKTFTQIRDESLILGKRS